MDESQRRRQHRSSSRSANNRPKKNKRYGTTSKTILQERYKSTEYEYQQRAMQRFDIEPSLTGIPDDLGVIKTHELSIQTNPVSLPEEERVASFVVVKGEWGWIDGERYEEVREFVSNSSMTLDQALSLRKAILQEKSVFSHRIMQSMGGKMYAEYKKGVSVVELSKKFDFPPMNIFRTILEKKGWSKSRIRDTLREPSKFKERERKEFEEAERADNVANVDQTERHQEADKFEDKIADWFESKGVRLRRQPELVREQVQEHGRSINTPDLLFLDHVIINGVPVAWIDAKHFYGADVKFQMRKTEKQMKRYCDEWGSGAIMFSHGFSANIYLPGVLMLDSTELGITKEE
ncbi:MAG: TPD domain-containing protein [Candidatus Poseidoniales archaeon]